MKTRLVVLRKKVTDVSLYTRSSFDHSFQSDRSSYLSPIDLDLAEGVRDQAFLVQAKPDVKNWQVHTFIRRQAQPSADLPLKVGASLDYLGLKITLLQITKSNLPSQPGSIAKNQWNLRLSVSSSGESRPTLAWHGIDRDGIQIRTVTPTGTPVYVHPHTRMDNYYPDSGPPKPDSSNLWPATIENFADRTYGRELNVEYDLYSNIDPSHMSALRAYGITATKLTITGIPLDPKP